MYMKISKKMEKENAPLITNPSRKAEKSCTTSSSFLLFQRSFYPFFFSTYLTYLPTHLRSLPLALIASQVAAFPNTLFVIVILVRDPTPHERGLAAADVNVLVEDLGRRLRHGHLLRNLDFLVDRGAGVLVEALELLLRGDFPVEQLLLESRDGVLRRAHALNLLTRAVRRARVGHGVAAVAVGDVLEDQGPVAFARVLLAVLDGGFDGEDVHTVDFEAGDVLAALVVFGQGGGAVGGGAHAVLVVWEEWRVSCVSWIVGGERRREWGFRTLAAEQDGEVPELGHVECLKDLALIAGAVPIEADRCVAVVLVLIGEGNAGTYRDLSADYPVAAVEAFCKHVHGSTFSVGDAFSTAK